MFAFPDFSEFCSFT